MISLEKSRGSVYCRISS